jgi:hypothetical protein
MTESDRRTTREEQAPQDPVWIANIPGMKRWGYDYETMVEFAGSESLISAGFTHQYVLDLSDNQQVRENDYCCVNRQYDCGHLAYGPPRVLPSDCPECADDTPPARQSGDGGEEGDVDG